MTEVLLVNSELRDSAQPFQHDSYSYSIRNRCPHTTTIQQIVNDVDEVKYIHIQVQILIIFAFVMEFMTGKQTVQQDEA